ncbi:RDD family protein [Corynebacterium hindlerae]|uniref:RDD family protein n=1 Tax=Corynebacterium hindlerae TaxID=699041 RepID=UPI001AD6EFCA|nr:RDD family protein [Corynebacterium hindlerae]QTH59551.1 RDD family protein [Corynebacterium hindlerae]
MEAKPVRQRLAREVRDALQPPIAHGEIEKYHAFLPGRNTGQRAIDNAPVTARVGALAIDVALFSSMFVTMLLGLSIAFAQGWFLAGVFVLPVAFYCWQTLLDTVGGSIGKRLMGLRVVGPADTPVDALQAGRRNLWLLIPMIPIAGPVAALGVGLWFAGAAKADAFGVAPHDRFSRIRVVKKLG